MPRIAPTEWDVDCLVGSMSRERLEEVVSELIWEIYWDKDEACWNTDKEINGADFVDAMTRLLSNYDLMPRKAKETK